jgi:hypothetical protein
MLNTWALLVRSGVHPRPGPDVDDQAGFPAKFVEVHPRHCRPDNSRFADWHRYHDFLGCTPFPLKVLQLVYPDEGGRFPGDEGYLTELAGYQRLLDH